MASAVLCTISDPKVQAFLKLLRWLENYPRDDVYNQMYGGLTFTDMSRHPNQLHTRWGKTSNAAGAYMALYSTWLEAVQKGVVSDYTPASQDTLAWWKIGKRHAQAAVCGGRGTLDEAFKLLRLEWSSLPGAGQNQVSVQAAKNRYETYLISFTHDQKPAAAVGATR